MITSLCFVQAQNSFNDRWLCVAGDHSLPENENQWQRLFLRRTQCSVLNLRQRGSCKNSALLSCPPGVYALSEVLRERSLRSASLSRGGLRLRISCDVQGRVNKRWMEEDVSQIRMSELVRGAVICMRGGKSCFGE